MEFEAKKVFFAASGEHPLVIGSDPHDLNLKGEGGQPEALKLQGAAFGCNIFFKYTGLPYCTYVKYVKNDQ